MFIKHSFVCFFEINHNADSCIFFILFRSSSTTLFLFSSPLCFKHFSRTTTQALDEVNQKKKRLEIRQEREIIRARKSIAKANEELIDTTQENTVQLERIAQLTNQQQTLERELNSGGSSGGDQGGIMRRDVEERNRLVQLVKLQAKEVDALKAEINMLRRKGGHVYTPAVSTSPSRGIQSGLHGMSAGSLGMESPEMDLPSR